jgi:diguanylate cyclase (GGDEF)-like protein
VLGAAGPASVIIVAVAVLLLLVGGLGFRNAQRALQEAANTDPLTRLGNRRSLLVDLEDRFSASRPRPFTLALFDLDGFKGYNDAFGHPAGDALLVRLGGKLTQAVAQRGAAYRVGGDEFCVVSDDPDAGTLVQAARTALSESGEGFLVTCSSGTVSLPSDAANSTEALRRADARLYEHKSGRPSSPEQQTADVLLKALHERYPELQGHLDAVGRLAEMVAERLELPTDLIRTIRRAGELHDVGKVAIPDQILRKPGPLDADEWEFMKTHSAVGERILDAAPALTAVARLVGAHHERFDGTGYPYGWSADRIPVGARIIAVCDAYHAMTSGRAYKAAVSHEEALRELLRYAGNQFDPTVVEAFREVADRIPRAPHGSAVAHGH